MASQKTLDNEARREKTRTLNSLKKSSLKKSSRRMRPNHPKSIESVGTEVKIPTKEVIKNKIKKKVLKDNKSKKEKNDKLTETPVKTLSMDSETGTSTSAGTSPSSSNKTNSDSIVSDENCGSNKKIKRLWSDAEKAAIKAKWISHTGSIELLPFKPIVQLWYQELVHDGLIGDKALSGSLWTFIVKTNSDEKKKVELEAESKKKAEIQAKKMLERMERKKLWKKTY